MKDGEEKDRLIEADQFLAKVADDIQDFPGQPALGIWRGGATDLRNSEETEKAKILILGQVDCAVGALVMGKIKAPTGKEKKKKPTAAAEPAAVADEGERIKKMKSKRCPNIPLSLIHI